MDCGKTLEDPFQDLFGKLMQQLISWAPQNVAGRDTMYKRARGLHHLLGLEKRCLGVAAHYFFCHYTERLWRHGNLLGMCSEGGERVHQPHSEKCERRPSCPQNKCPLGLVVCMQDSRIHLAFWRQGWMQIACSLDESSAMPAT